MSYGGPAAGRHVTIYANPGHAYMAVDGRRFDTSATARRLALDGHARSPGRLRRAPPAGPLGRRVPRGGDREPGAAELDDVVAEDLAPGIVLVEVERLAGGRSTGGGSRAGSCRAALGLTPRPAREARLGE